MENKTFLSKTLVDPSIKDPCDKGSTNGDVVYKGSSNGGAFYEGSSK
jgi:hypothetical protein